MQVENDWALWKGGWGHPSSGSLKCWLNAAPRTLGHLGGTKISDFELYGLFRFCLLTRLSDRNLLHFTGPALPPSLIQNSTYHHSRSDYLLVALGGKLESWFCCCCCCCSFFVVLNHEVNSSVRIFYFTGSYVGLVLMLSANLPSEQRWSI